MNGPLEGVKVVELSTWAAVPCAGQLMGDWGADVIKIEHPEGGDPTRGWAGPGWLPPSAPAGVGWIADNRSKRSIALDLSKEAGREVAHRLVKDADVFATNLQDASLERIAMDYDALAGVNPRLIYAHLTGYGRKGPTRDRAGFDHSAFWASSGIMSLIGERGTPPAFQRPAMGDHMATGYLVAGILAALRARDKTGVGQRVDMSLMGTGLWINSWQTQATLLTGEEARRVSQKDMPNPLFNVYRARDDRWFILVMVFTERFWPPFCQVLGRPQLEHDPRFATAQDRARNCRELISIIQEVMATRTSAEWAPLFDEHQLVWAFVHSVKSALDDPQTEANGFLVRLEHAELGSIRAVNSPVSFSATPSAAKTPPPQLGQHTEEILLASGYDWNDIVRLKNERAII